MFITSSLAGHHPRLYLPYGTDVRLLKTYLEGFDPRIVALTGTPEEPTAAAKAFRITYR
jgi:cytochrome oxidase Cu insertion factor (SCO1/SenC/PrrC family)